MKGLMVDIVNGLSTFPPDSVCLYSGTVGELVAMIQKIREKVRTGEMCKVCGGTDRWIEKAPKGADYIHGCAECGNEIEEAI